MNIIPKGNALVIRIPRPPETTESDVTLYMPVGAVDRKQKYSVTGQVVGIGPDAFKGLIDGDIRAKVGDWVIMPRQAGLGLVEGSAVRGKHSDSFNIVMDSDILAVVEAPRDTNVISVSGKLVAIADENRLTKDVAVESLRDVNLMFHGCGSNSANHLRPVREKLESRINSESEEG